MKILITGFMPFNNEPINPSFEAVKKLPNMIGDIEIRKLELPVTYNGGFNTLYNEIKDDEWDRV